MRGVAGASPETPRLRLSARAAAEVTPALMRWYARHERPLPWRVLWRRHRDPYHVWVSEIMLQQTVIKAVVPVYARFLERFPSPAALAAADEAEVREAVRGLGYYRRFRLLHAACRQLTAAGGQWPTTVREWRALPGVGDYTAAAVASICFGAPEPVVDGNVERVIARLTDFRSDPATPAAKKAVKAVMAAVLDHGDPGAFNQAVMELGQTVCTPTGPDCAACPVKAPCLARKRQSQHLAPTKARRPAPVAVALTLVIQMNGGRVGLGTRPDNARFLKGLPGFATFHGHWPEALTPEGRPDVRVALPESAVRPLGTVRHSITSHRITAAVLLHTAAGRRPGQTQAPETTGLSWHRAEDLERLLTSNLDRKAWRLAEAYLRQRVRR